MFYQFAAIADGRYGSSMKPMLKVVIGIAGGFK
jgi:hypothetical protein